MALILNIETATKNCSVSIARQGEVLAIKELNDGNYSHAEKLHPFILEVIKDAQIAPDNLDAIAVSKGPGSYTGLRIGVSSAKGLCFAYDIPLISTNTLKALALSVKISEGYVVPMIDARRMEVYSAVFNKTHEQEREIKAEIIDTDSFSELLETDKVYFVGDGAQKCIEVIKHSNAIFEEVKYPSSAEMAKLSYEKYKKNQFEDVAYFEPFYLKDFVVTPEKKK